MTGSERGSYAFLVNPASGAGAASAAVMPVARALREAGAQVEVVYSRGPRQVLGEVDAAVARGDVVVSVGGDGMLSSVAGQVATRGGTLGLLPAGRGNDFARMLGLETDPASVAQVLLAGTTRSVDLLRVIRASGAEDVVVSSVYAGVDAVAGRIVDRVRWLPGRLQYPYAALHALATYRPVRAHVEVDGVAHTFTAATVVVANSAYYGSGMRIAPSAQVDDGLLDVVVIEAASRHGLIRALPKVYDGAHVELDEVHVLRGRSVRLHGTPGAPMGGDGEPLDPLPTSAEDAVRVEVWEGALQVLAP
ncbi:diacylglycerol/lipid kinase family protein [Nocardioides massiliensis]|uniref:Diacylglycerol kinase family enzyme n=1 Tax=Nocardioides massiliensis TaxID=1325935 RepID=A0ABT9NNF3_9ACTN|nr:diacylglycerol kinase family protein [Nocardioides massiliensis]MDP9821951.1 diacylglycerol kinase family enzyme [Nocardioides massiliensis]